ncbi:MAG: HlyU family transcriptional regulator [Geminicoccaceae bacterium]|nr:HlyU family transcriptional regulator [Geminicoccaceae bacterium]MCX7630860.1 HlyU family transcriptional regulator [Geminicoccaceae bacterium]MDW8369088.1 HlyU family transcriptional regulator [Geminicoccaceae bacterium]
MALGDLLRRLFGGGGASDEPDRAAAVEYRGYRIVPLVRRQGGQFLTCAMIEKEFPDGIKSHELIRADTHGSADEASAFAVRKARQAIDEQGDRLFR